MALVDVEAGALDEARTFNAAVEDLLAKAPSVHTVPPAQTRQTRADGRGTFPPPVIVDDGRDREVPGLDGGAGGALRGVGRAGGGGGGCPPPPGGGRGPRGRP